MQLKSVRGALALATSSLLSAISAPCAGADKAYDVNLSELYYSETDRVTVKKLQVLGNAEIRDQEFFRANFIYDTITGASPNGRIYTGDGSSDATIPVTTASGFSYTAKNTAQSAADAPWLTDFSDTRVAGDFQWQRPWFRNLTTTLGASASNENDYSSKGASAKLALDVNERRTTLAIGASINGDTVSPNGNIPQDLGTLWCSDTRLWVPDWIQCDAVAPRYKPGDKIITDYIAGVSQVWNRTTVVQLNYAHGRTAGYLSDPYKAVSVVRDDYGEVAILHEKRPDTRSTNSIYWQIVNVPTKDSINLSVRYFWDDWGIQAQTVDLHLRLEINPHFYLQPHARYSHQSAAYFFEKQISSASTVSPTYVSADHRLSEQSTVTLGLKMGIAFNNVNVAIRGEYLQQKYQDALLPDLNGIISQLLFVARF